MSHQRRRISPRVVVQMLVFVVVVPFLPLLISGHWDWWEAWAYALIGIFGFVISRALAARRHPDLLAERARFLQHEDAAAWVKLIAPDGLAVSEIPVDPDYPMARVWLVAGVQPAGGTPGAGRHPGRLRPGILCLARQPLLLRHGADPDRARPPRGIEWPLPLGAASRLRRGAADLPGHADLPGPAWAFLPALSLTIVLVIRTRLKDRTLQKQLKGYRDYAARVRYRLPPGVW